MLGINGIICRKALMIEKSEMEKITQNLVLVNAMMTLLGKAKIQEFRKTLVFSNKTKLKFKIKMQSKN
jgi:hypothetical protein